jgi:hypothetical protein
VISSNAMDGSKRKNGFGARISRETDGWLWKIFGLNIISWFISQRDIRMTCAQRRMYLCVYYAFSCYKDMERLLRWGFSYFR